MSTKDKSAAFFAGSRALKTFSARLTAKYAVLVSIVSHGYTLLQVPASHFSVGNLTERGLNA